VTAPPVLDASVRVRRGAFTLDAHLRVGAGEICALVGPNGAGKTTLLRVLAGLDAVDGGRVVLDGAPVDDPAAGVFVPAERRPVGMVFQDTLLFPHLDALDNVAFGLRARGAARRAARSEAARWLDRLGLAPRRTARPASLSGGEAQRVALARALVTRPVLLLLDEPLAALDVRYRAELRRGLRDALAGFPGARVIVTHDPIEALSLADRIVVLEAGTIVQEGPPADIVARPRSPFVAELVGVNLYRGVADGYVVDVDGSTIAIATAHRGPVFATIPPRAVVLHREAPSGTARNVWAGTVDGVERVGDRVRVHVAGPLPIVGEVTPAAVAALALRPGVAVWAAVKATEVDVSPF
jgi:molybdate transport system ATP-binding protein